jgi:hypothetical protein
VRLGSFLAALLCGGAAAAQPRSPANGIDERPRRGTYVETALGVFTAMGGSATFSSAQPFLGMTLGRELGDRASVFASLGIGATRASCYQLDAAGQSCAAADSFGATFLELGGAYGVEIASRTLLSLKIVGGYTDLSPGPVLHNGSVRSHTPGFHAGAGFAVDYATHLDHFAVGIDALVRYTHAADDLSLASLAVLPRIRYVF